MSRKRTRSLIPAERIERSILFIREHKVLLDSDLAAIYGVTTARLNQQVRRNIDRFPEDFAFVLSKAEFADLKLQFATSSSGWGGRRKPPFVFTEHGAVMAASVLQHAHRRGREHRSRADARATPATSRLQHRAGSPAR